MKKLIEKIEGFITTTGKSVTIEVNGNNLIIVGGNGCGKTSFLQSLNKKIKNNIDMKGIIRRKGLLETIKMYSDAHDRSNDKIDRQSYLSNINTHKKQLSEIDDGLSLTYNSAEEYIELHEKKQHTTRFFDAHRIAKIAHAESAKSYKPELNNIKIDENLGCHLEEHLLNLKVRSALAKDNDVKKSKEIDNWISKFEKNLKFLFEDDSTKLEFDAEKMKFRINQKNKPPYTFQNLSSGYLSIFDIYSDLLIRTAYLDITPEELSGVAIIDEIDVHLHISLQRKILPFFINSFPKIQFIVSTHSPFILSSVEDCLIYNLSTGQTENDLSMYSMESITEGLLGVPIISKKLESLIKELALLMEKEITDITALDELLDKIQIHEDHLDTESKMFYNIAKNKSLNFHKNNK